MKHVRMLEDHDGARKGDVIGVEHEPTADKLIENKKAVPVLWVADKNEFVDKGE